MSEEWRAMLMLARKRLRVSREDLAERCGISASTIRGYEIGRRHPRQESLEQILQALQLERTESNPIRESAGFAAITSLWDHRATYYFTVDELQEYVEDTAWPQFVVNDTMEVVAANRAAGALWGVDFQTERCRRSGFALNLLAVASEFNFPERIERFDDVLELLCSIFKGVSIGQTGGATDGNLADPTAYLAQVVQHFTDHDHRFLDRLLAAWTRAEPSPAKVRWRYSVVWKHALGRMSFAAQVGPASEREGLAFNDWIPANAQTWTAMDALLRAQGDDPAAMEARAIQPRRILGD